MTPEEFCSLMEAAGNDPDTVAHALRVKMACNLIDRITPDPFEEFRVALGVMMSNLVGVPASLRRRAAELIAHTAMDLVTDENIAAIETARAIHGMKHYNVGAAVTPTHPGPETKQ